MFLDIDPWIYGKLTAALGSTARVDYWYPNDFVNLPAIAYRTTQRMSDIDYYDDQALYSDCTLTLDVYAKDGTDDFSLCNAVATAMMGILFNMDLIEPVPDPDAKIIHKTIVFSRAGISQSDLN